MGKLEEYIIEVSRIKENASNIRRKKGKKRKHMKPRKKGI